MKILYCIAGMWSCGVLESEVLKRDGLILSAKRTFSLEPDQSQIATSRGQINLNVVTYSNVMMNCNLIADLNEQSIFYKEVVKFIEKEVPREN